MGVTANEFSVSFGDDENLLKFNMVVIVQLCEYTKKTLFNWVICWYMGYISIKMLHFKKCTTSVHNSPMPLRLMKSQVKASTVVKVPTL